MMRIHNVVYISGLVFLVAVGSAIRAEVPELMLTLTNAIYGEEYGYRVANVGDMNGDGDPDLLVGALRPIYNGFGRGYLYFGGAAFDTLADVVFVSEEWNEYYASALAGAGDLNGDGYSDIIIGAPANNMGGKAYIYFGGPVVDSLPDVEIHGNGGSFAGNLAGCGDVNVDGYDDVVITAFDAGPGMTGEAYVYFGGSPMDTLVDLYLDPGGSHDAFGLGVCAGEDVNGDGYPDIVVGDAHWLSGRAYLYFGGPSLDNVADLVLEGEGSNAHFGIGLAMGDLNADGAAEVIAGATRWCPPNSIANGRAYVYYGGEMLDDIPDVIVTGQTQGQRLGGGVLATTDLNLDGYRDLCIWAQYPERFLFHAGEGWMDRVEEAVVVSPGPWNDWFGSGFAAFGVDDLTGDSLPDLVIGACGVDVDRLQNAGMVYVYSFFHGPVEIRAVPRTPEVHPGERLRYAVGATNTTWRVQTFEVWSGALMPDGFLYEGNPIWGPLERTLAAQDTVVVQLNQRIPPATPPGQYTWTVRVGAAYPDTVWSSSSFEFKVVEP